MSSVGNPKTRPALYSTASTIGTSGVRPDRRRRMRAGVGSTRLAFLKNRTPAVAMTPAATRMAPATCRTWKGVPQPAAMTGDPAIISSEAAKAICREISRSFCTLLRTSPAISVAANEQPPRCQDGGGASDRQQEGHGGERRPDGLDPHRRRQEARRRTLAEGDQPQPERCDDQRGQHEEEVAQGEPGKTAEPGGEEHEPDDAAARGGSGKLPPGGLRLQRRTESPRTRPGRE